MSFASLSLRSLRIQGEPRQPRECKYSAWRAHVRSAPRKAHPRTKLRCMVASASLPRTQSETRMQCCVATPDRDRLQHDARRSWHIGEATLVTMNGCSVPSRRTRTRSRISRPNQSHLIQPRAHARQTHSWKQDPDGIIMTRDARRSRSRADASASRRGGDIAGIPMERAGA